MSACGKRRRTELDAQRMDELEALMADHECDVCQSHERCQQYMALSSEFTELLMADLETRVDAKRPKKWVVKYHYAQGDNQTHVIDAKDEADAKAKAYRLMNSFPMCQWAEPREEPA